MKKLFTLFLFVCLCGWIQAQPAFPGAEGFGATATGGRGGSVYVVTNLNDSGTGSFRDAVSQSNRIVVFAVGGVININSAITVQSNTTIAGQTAPGEGIAIYGNTVAFKSNVICRYIRFHGSINMPSGNYTLSAGGVDRGMFDHVSVLWGRWDNMKLDGSSKNITFQYCLVSEAILPQKLGALFETPSEVTVHHTLWSNNKSRNPKAKANIEYVNNVVYNWGSDALVLGHSSATFNQDIIGNFFLAGPSSSAGGLITQASSTDRIYTDNNFKAVGKNGTLNGSYLTNSDLPSSATKQSARYYNTSRQPTYPVTIDNPIDAFHKVVAKVGASKNRDAVDRRLIAQVNSYGIEGALITREGDVGGQPAMISGIPAKDTNKTGIPDWWASAMGQSGPATSTWALTLRNGYREIEHYINSIVTAGAVPAEITGITPSDGKVVNYDHFTEGSVTNSQNLKIYGKATPNATVSVARVDIATPLGTTIADANGDWVYDYSAVTLSDRYYAFMACVDNAGTLSYPSAAHAVHVQTTSSLAPDILRMTTLPEKAFFGTTVPYGTVSVFIQGNNTPIATGTADGYGNWNATTNQTFSSQEYSFVASTLELSGVTTILSNPFNVNMAIPTPVVTAISPITGDQTFTQITSSQNLTFSGTSQSGNIIKLYYIFNNEVSATNVGTATADGSGNWTLSNTSVTLPEGVYTLMATADNGATPSPMSAPFIVDIDRTRPTVASIHRQSPDATSTSLSTLVYQVTFAEPVSGVTQSNFTVTRSGISMTGDISNFQQIDATTYLVTVSNASGDGTIRVDLRSSQNAILDRAGNQCSAAYTGGQTYTMRFVGSGVWSTDQDGDWIDKEMWEDEALADGVGATADFSQIDVTEQTVVSLTKPINLGRFIIADADEESAGTWRIATTSPNNIITLGYSGTTVPEIKVNYDNDDTGNDYNKSAKGRNYPATIEAPLQSSRGFRKTGWGTLQLNGANNISGAITVEQGTLRLGTGGVLNLNAGMTLSEAGCAFYVNGGTFSTNSTFTMDFASESKLVVSAGKADFKQIVSGNSRNGEIIISGGTMTADEVMIKRNSDGSISWSSGFLVSGGSATIGTLGLGTDNSWGVGRVTGGKLTVTNVLYIAYQSSGGRGGGLRVSAGELVVSGNDGIILSRKRGSNANNVASLEITGGTVTTKRLALGYDSSVNAGSATLTMSGNNSSLYLGSGGLVRPGASSGFTATVTLSGGTLGADENWTTTVPLALGGNITIKAANASNVARNITLGGVISGSSRGFTKTGTGTLTLTANNTYGGTTTLSAGILRVGNGGTTGRINGAINVQANAILAGSGIANGTVTVAANGVVHSGAETTSPTTLTINNLTLNSAILRFNLYQGDACDKINLTGTLTASGTNTIDITELISGTYNLGKLSELSGATVTLNGQPINSDIATATLSVTDGNLYLTIENYTGVQTHNINNTLKAWLQNGTLNVSGLITGELWKVYSTSGTLLYQAIAVNEQESISINLPSEIYIVVQGLQSIKVSEK